MNKQGSTAQTRVTPLQPQPRRDQRSWISFLEEQLPAHWLPGEWEPKTGILTPLPDTGRFSVVTCSRPECLTIIENRRTCESCLKQRRDSKHSSARPSRVPPATPVQRDCVLTRHKIQCGRNQVSQGLCRAHFALFKASRKGADVRTWLKSSASTAKAFIACAAAGCPISADNLTAIHICARTTSTNSGPNAGAATSSTSTACSSGCLTPRTPESCSGSAD